MEYSFVFLFFIVLCCSAKDDLYTDSDSSDISRLDEVNFNYLVKDSPNFWLIEFYSPGCEYCGPTAGVIKYVSRILRGIVRVGVINVDQCEDLQRTYNASALPKIAFFGPRDEKILDFQGDRSIIRLVTFALQSMKYFSEKRRVAEGESYIFPHRPHTAVGSSESEEIKEFYEVEEFEKYIDGSDDIWMILYTRYCGKTCDDALKLFKDLSIEEKGKMRFGVINMDTERNITEKYKPGGYPSISGFFPGSDMANPSTHQPNITQESLRALFKLFVAHGNSSIQAHQLVNASLWEKNCLGNKGICSILFLPNLETMKSAKRSEIISEYEKLVRYGLKFNYTLFWSAAGEQLKLEEAFGIAGQYPSMIAINNIVKKYGVMGADYNKLSADNFIREIKNGKAFRLNVTDLDKIKISEVKSWKP